MDKSREINIKTRGHYYFDYITNIKDLDFEKILVYETSFQNIFGFRLAYKTLFNEKPLSISFDNVYENIEKDGRDICFSMKNMNECLKKSNIIFNRKVIFFYAFYYDS